MIIPTRRKMLIRIILAFICLIGALSMGGWSWFKKEATPEQMIEDIGKMTISSAEKKLDGKKISYSSGISFEYATYKGRNYDEIRLFYDNDDHNKIQDINFVMDYHANKEDIDNLIWAFNKKFGTPETGTSVADIGSFDYHYYLDSSSEKIAYVKIFDYGKAEVDYFYTNHWEPKQLKLFDLNQNTDVMTVLRSIDHYYKIENEADMIGVDFGQSYMLSNPSGLSSDSKFYFNKETRTLKQYYAIYEPFYYSGQDSMGRAIADLMYASIIETAYDLATEKWGNPTKEAENYYSTGVSYTKYTWKGDGITLRISYSDSISFLTFNVDAMWN